jgi:surface carbohydrate biosynthesis protein (TIGR04326 family)
MKPLHELLISDLDFASKKNKSDLIYWSNYECSESDSIFSIPLILEQNADLLKARFLSLIYEFGEGEIEGERLIEHLLIRKNFSYWWMTQLVEKCNYAKSPQIDNIIKLMALEEFCKKKKYKKLKLITSNVELAKSILLYSKSAGIEFEWKKIRNKKFKSISVHRIFHHLPNIIKSPIWLVHYLCSNWALIGAGVDEWRNTKASSTFVSYLFNLVPSALKEGRYESRYWTTLTSLLDKNNHSSNWIHIYIKDSLLPSAKEARNAIQKFNSEQHNNQVHVTLASFLSVRVILSTLNDFYRVKKLNKIVEKYIKLKSHYFWPLFNKDYKDSMTGIPAIKNILFFNLFEKAMNDLPKQNMGCYLQENQGWEFGFIHAWQSEGHKNLIGFPHAAVIYWDLRNFFDPRTYFNKNKNRMPLPNFVGLNGDVSKKMYLSGGYPPKDLIEIESLRFLYLLDFTLGNDARELKKSNEKVVLVAGDYLKENTHKQLNLLESAISAIDHSVKFIFKPHPACPVDLKDFPKLRGELSMKPIQELMKISDVVYTSLVTSAAVDAYCADLPVISFLDGKTLNVSPLRNAKGVYFVSNSKGLAKAINTFRKTESDQLKNYFYLDSALPRWHRCLSSDLLTQKNS